MSAACSPVAVLSGKGGVGKTNLVANVAVAAAGLGSKVLVVDGDLGLANIDVLLGLAPRDTAADVIEGRCSFEDALLTGPRGIEVLPAASGRSDLPGYRPDQLAGLLVPFFQATERYDLVLVDAGAGVGTAVMTLAAACKQALLIATAEPTAFADAYATLKVLRQEAPSLPVEVVVNHAPNDREGRKIHERLRRVSERFLEVSPPYAGFVPRDPRLGRAVAQQRSVVELYPGAASTQQFESIARYLLGLSHEGVRNPSERVPSASLSTSNQRPI